MKHLLLILPLLLLVACNNGENQQMNGPVSSETKNGSNTNQSEKIRECEEIIRKRDSINESLGWKLLKCGLWINKKGEFGFKTLTTVCSERHIADRYITSLDENKALRDVIDTNTFKEIGDNFFKDKNHIYHHYSMAEGGNFYIFDKADYKTFEVLNDCYARDKYHIFESQNGIMENVDYATFKTIKGLGACVAKDKYGYFIWNDRVKINEVKDEVLLKALKQLDK